MTEPTPDLQQAIATLEQQAAPGQDDHDEATIAAEPITEADRDLVRKATTGRKLQQKSERRIGELLEQLRAAHAENQQLRKVLDELWMAATDRGPLPKPVFDRVRAALEQQAALGQDERKEGD